jgi:hypothetical protein
MEREDRGGGGGGTGVRRATRGQSETIGVVLILAIAVIGTTSVVALGSSAMEETRTHSEVERAGHAMTLFDASAATVGLGDAVVRSVGLDGSSGSYEVAPDAGRLTITHVDYDGDGDDSDSNDDGNESVRNDANLDDGSDDDDHPIYNGTLGSVAYRNGGREVAYQGGGVWKQSEDGGSTMLSPPEFHYREATLTLPVLRVTGVSDDASGGTQATIEKDETVGTSEVFPDTSESYPAADGDGDDGMSYRNPTDQGRVAITVESEYYRAWGSYFESRTEGNVSYDDAGERVRLTLVSTGQKGAFSMPMEGNSIDIRGLEKGHRLKEFGITVRPDDTDSADFSNLQWSLWAEGDGGGEQFEMHVRRSGGSDCAEPMNASLTLYYSEDGGDTYEGWYEDAAFETTCDADGNAALEMGFSDDGDADGDFDEDDGADDPDLTYQSLSKSDLSHFNPNGDLVNSSSSPTFDEHSGTVDWESKSYAAGDTEAIDRLLNHYFGLMGPDIELTVDDKNSNTVSEGASTGTVDYDGSGKYVTYLHVSENGITVELH